MSGVVVVGSINVDLVVTADRLPRPGETVLGGQFARHFGGKGANQAVAAARAGASVTMIGAVGRDPDGDESLAALSAEGVDVSHVRRVDAPTGVAIIAVAAGGENQIVVAPGANAEVSREDADVTGIAQEGDVLLTCLEIPIAAVVAALASATGLGGRAILNPAPGRRLAPELLALRPILTPNQDELLAASGAPDPESALAALLAAGAAAVIVTLGSAGALLAEADRRVTVPAIPGRPARAVDATGAGDAFSGVLAAWLAGSSTLDEAASAANAAAMLSVSFPGAREGMPNRAAIEDALRG
jgi:ribokinase